MAYRSTTLQLASKHCPRAVDFYENGVPYGREIYQVGIAAHHVLQAISEAANKTKVGLLPEEVESASRQICEKLITKGRTFEGHQEPPMAPDSVWRGRDLALEWISEYPIGPGWQPEIGLAVDEDWKPVDYSESAYYTGLIDLLRVYDDWGEEARIMLVRDYKSAWSADAEELETTQRHGQACLAWSHLGNDSINLVRLEVGNLRTRRLFTLELWPEHDLADVLDRWRRDIDSTIDSLEKMKRGGKRPAVPGAGCCGCPFYLQCDAGQDYLERASIIADFGSPAERAKAYASAVGAVAALKPLLKRDSEEKPIDIGEAVVGTVPSATTQAADDAYAEAWDTWAERFSSDGSAGRAFAKAVGMTAGNLSNLAQAMWPHRADRDRRAKWLSKVTKTESRRAFGIHPKEEKP